jgi:transcriptional regulator with XRE-family HTH domain
MAHFVELRAQVRSGRDIGRAIGNIRRQRGETQAELAERLGLTRSRVAQIESGRTSPIIEHELRALRAMGASVTITWPNDEHG